MVDKAVPVLNQVFHLAKEPLKLKEEIANSCLEEEAYDYAFKLYRSIVEQDKNRSDLLLKMGIISERTGDLEEAMGYLTEAEKLDDKNLEIKLHSAKIYLKQGMMLRAEKPLKQILKVSPHHKEARELLRQCI